MRRLGGKNSVLRFLYRAQVALEGVSDVETMCATAARRAVPRLADACTVSGLGGDVLRDRTWRAGQPGPWDLGDPQAVPLVAGGQPVGLILLHRDSGRASGRRSAMARSYARVVGRALDRVLSSARDRTGFAAELAHELRNAIAPLSYGAAVLGRSGPDSPGGRAACERLVRQVGRLNEVLDGMLDLARAERGKLALRVQPVELAAVLRDAAVAVGPLITGRKHRLTARIDAAVGEVWADSSRLGQVLTNLLSNAAKYTEPGGRIDLTADREGCGVVIRVRDTGVGIEPGLLPRLFTRFVQADAGRGGLGLGLALVKQLVELHGGTVAARSDGPGTGSEFVVRLPDRPDPA
jgi:signal transduction histidine kinase